MLKIKNKELSEKLENYVKLFDNKVLKLNESKSELHCKACDKQIKNSFKKFNITQHFSTQKHIKNMKQFNCEQNNNDLDLICEQNKSLKSELKFGESLTKIFVLTKEILNNCKCIETNGNKNELKELLEDFELKLNQNNVSKSIKTEQNCDKKSPKRGTKLCSLKSIEQKKQRQWSSCLWPGCDRKFGTLSQLESHLCVHSGEKRFKCFCGKSYGRKQSLLCHKQTHDKSSKGLRKVVKCDWSGCEKVFQFKYQMNRHLKINHLKLINYKCDWPQCERGFGTKDQYDVHVGQSHVGQALYACDWPECGKRFTTRSNLLKHNNYIHLKQKRYKCDFDGCQQSFTRKEQLESHAIEAHNADKPLSCDWPGCEFSTLYSRNLQKHKMRHTGERPYKCSWPQCEWSFRQSDHLKTHMLKHTGERPVACDWAQCELRFQSKRAMKIHFDKTHHLLV